MIAYLTSVLDRALAVPNGPLLVTILAGCALAAFALLMVFIVRPDDGYIENPKPPDYVYRMMSDE